jgi:hypothetical protein
MFAAGFVVGIAIRSRAAEAQARRLFSWHGMPSWQTSQACVKLPAAMRRITASGYVALKAATARMELSPRRRRFVVKSAPRTGYGETPNKVGIFSLQGYPERGVFGMVSRDFHPLIKGGEKATGSAR